MKHDIELLKKLCNTSGISGFESNIAEIMKKELNKSCDKVETDLFGNVIARKGKGKKKIMLAAHMDEIGLMVKHITKEGYLNFVKIGGIDDRILLGQRVVIESKKGSVLGIIGSKPPHMQKGCKDKKEAEKKVEVGDPIVFEKNFGNLNGDLYYGKAIDNRIGCYAMIKIMEEIEADAEIYAVATAQEEVGLKGARTSSFKINPDLAIAIDTTIAGDTPQMKENESSLKIGNGVAITMIEASGRGVIVNQKIREIFIETAKKNKIKYQIDVLEGGMTDGATIYISREGIPTGVLSIPTRYIHSPTAVFSIKDVESAITLTLRSIKNIDI